jgi:hypothetical protein
VWKTVEIDSIKGLEGVGMTVIVNFTDCGPQVEARDLQQKCNTLNISPP